MTAVNAFTQPDPGRRPSSGAPARPPGVETGPPDPHVESGHHVDVSRLSERDLLASCVHCGLCLEVCPTYQLTFDENNSPRGRLRLWREEAEGRLERDSWTDFYTAACVGCRACESACPANVPYGEIFEEVRHSHVEQGRYRPRFFVRLAARLATRYALFQRLALPARLLRRAGLLRHRFVFPGRPALMLSTAAYARRLMKRHQPTGARVALLTGCLMEAFFRELNFATVRVLIENNLQVVVPDNQTCCGALHEHIGLGAIDKLREQNRNAFEALEVDAVLSNSSGCGLALSNTLDGRQVVCDVLHFLGQTEIVRRQRRNDAARVYVDLPCHLIHGQKLPGIPANVLDATGYDWEFAPQARDCCGSGGVYNLQQPQNAREMLARKATFLREAVGDPVILATANHVCMMQWNSAGPCGLVSRPYLVRHVIQLLDPGE